MTSAPITIVTDDNFFEEVLQSDKLVLIDFYADWCGPCQSLAPTLEKFAEENQDKVKVVKINVDDCPLLTARFEVKSIPLLVTMHEGQGLFGLIGAAPKSEIENLVNESFKFIQQSNVKPDPKGPSLS